ncbi:YozE family protein [Lactobacillus equicursoris]|uniref:YozE family protein n=1 Tax=Lactobacillus equicursoris TaxID=420645 RepID=UPI00242D84B7|nr:YozE family protein [Lactobacillus equicursoris]MDD6386749.1 YozE family protein [Lactobacillus equicursoris]
MAYRQSFYQFLMTLRNPDSNEDIAAFANNAQFDSTFPRHEQDYEKLSEYLEENAAYLPSMTIFDEAYQDYKDKMQY